MPCFRLETRKSERLVRAIIENPIYKGTRRFGDERSEVFEDLRIIDLLTFGKKNASFGKQLLMYAVQRYFRIIFRLNFWFILCIIESR